MTDKRKNKRLEELSKEGLDARIKEDKKKAGRSIIFMFPAVIAIIVICIAWFVANTRVRMTSGTISADDSSSFVLASTGQRQNAEQSWLKNGNGNILIEGKKEQYSKYIDCSTGSETTTGETTYYVGTSNLAWHLSEGEESLSPGQAENWNFTLLRKWTICPV